MKISNDIKFVGVNDYEIDLFEGQYKVPYGMSYNSYVILDEKIAVFDTVDARFTNEWLSNLERKLAGRNPDYLIVQHMEPDHSANIESFVTSYPDVKIVSSSKAFTMMKNFFGTDFSEKRVVVGDGDILSLGKHTLTFFTAPMVHWPEVIVTYDSFDKVLFSADGFGKFGALDRQDEWVDEARRYYIGIVGKYGVQVQALLKKAASLDIAKICPLHGPVLDENLAYYLDKYNTWSEYRAEEEGVVIAYTSIYGNTKKAIEELEKQLRKKGCSNVVVYDLARCDMALAVSDAFRYSKLVLASTTYNADIFPFMRQFVDHLVERNFSNRTVAIIENGSWAPMVVKIIKNMMEKCKNIMYAENNVKILSALNDDSRKSLEQLSDELAFKTCSSLYDCESASDTSSLNKYVCKVCGFVYEGESIPDDFLCPLCKRGISDFEKIN